MPVALPAPSTEDATWYVVPADNKWFTRVVVAAAVVDTLGGLDLRYPAIDEEKGRERAAAKRALLGGKAHSPAAAARRVAYGFISYASFNAYA